MFLDLSLPRPHNAVLDNGLDQEQLRPPIRVAICMEHPLVRAGLRAALQSEHDVDIVCDVSDVREAHARYRRTSVDVVVTQASPAVLATFSAATDSPASRAGDRTVLVAGQVGDAMILNAIKAGIRGIVSEQGAEAELAPAVRAVAAGGAFLSPNHAGGLMDWLSDRLAGQPFRVGCGAEQLTDREREVLELLGKGRSNREIAKELVISETTVRSHVYHIMTKLNLRTRTHAVLFGYQFRLGDTTSPGVMR